jgi:hypothetical protein
MSVLDLETMHPLDPQTLLGMPVAEAGARCMNANRMWRVVGEDGVSYAITADYRVGRVNLWVEKGLVTNVDIEGEGMSSA